MEDLKFKIESEEMSEEIQAELFRLGYSWPFSGKNPVWVGKPWLSTSIVGQIMWHEENQVEDFYRCKLTTLDQLRKMV